jgi:N-acetylglucosamine-6-sulfatase
MVNPRPLFSAILRRMKLAPLGVAVVVVLALIVAGEVSEAGPAAKPPPNIVVIETDDQTADSVRFMVNVRSELARGGTTFTNAFAATPLATPSRATLLTGRYAHNDGVRAETGPAGGGPLIDATSTLPVWLQRAGYTTAMIGRYLSGYGTDAPSAMPPGWNEWDVAVDPWSTSYYDYALNQDGTLVSYGDAPSDYQTDVLAAKAGSTVDRLLVSGEPFFLWLSFLAPRAAESGAGAGVLAPGPEPAPRHASRLTAEQLPTPPSFNEANVRDKPASVRARPLLSGSSMAAIKQRYVRRLESLLAVDEAVGSLVGKLRAAGKLDDTLIVFTSGSGFMQGEHRIPSGAGAPYEPSIRIPLILRGPGVPHDHTVADPVATVDLAPTILDAARAKADQPLDGTSLLPLASDPLAELGRDILLETRTYSGLRTPRFKYIEYGNGARELYDLAVDPYELTNRVRSPAYDGVRAELVRRLALLRGCSGSGCRRGPRLTLTVTPTARGRAQRCGVRLALGGADIRLVGRLDVYLDSTRIARDGKPPFRVTVPGLELGGSLPRLRAHVELSDSRRLTISRSVRAC